MLPSLFSLRPSSLCLMAFAALAGALAWQSGAIAQTYPPPPAATGASSPMCQRLVGQLAAIDNAAAGGDSAKAEQIRRYEDAQGRQQAELERVQAQAKRQGCDSSGFFSLFTGPSAQCGPINTQIQQMRANLDQITTSLERLRGGSFGSSERDNQRRSVLLALAQNNCGPQYANAARGGGNFLENLFGGGSSNPGGDYGAPASTYRTVCARSCDGFYFPISFATVPSRFADDERVCKALCPAAEATLYTYPNPGGDMNQAVSISGQPYSQSPNAFRFRTSFDKSCSCKPQGQTWSEALKHIDDRGSVEQGDIIVTDERSKKMAQPPSPKAPAANQKKAPASAPPASAQAAPPDPAPTATAPTSGDKPIRSVGPTFLPAR